MSPFPGALAPSSVYLLGLHQAMLLADEAGQAALAGAHDPLPLSADRGRNHRTDVRDPFADAHRDLTFTVAPDASTLDPKTLRDLLSLARLPHVTLDVAFPTDQQVSQSLGTVDVTRQGGDAIAVTTTRHPGRTAFEHHDETWASLLADHTGLPVATAAQVHLGISVHHALGNDYLISPALVLHRNTNAFWGRRTGVCSVEEAMFLAGVKARLYRTVPIWVGDGGSFSITTGWLYDASIMSLSRRFRAAVAGALSPSAPTDERASLESLLTIRNRLRDLLVIRDELIRLERREALGRSWPGRIQDDDQVLGGSGNDIVIRVDYLVTAALNAFTTILDNLAFVASARENLHRPAHLVGFDRLLQPNDPLGRSQVGTWLQVKGVDHPAIRQALALKAFRNVADHRSGLSYGWVQALLHGRPEGPEVLAVWLWRGDTTYRLPGGVHPAAEDDLAPLAMAAYDDVLIIRPRLLAEVALARAIYVGDQTLGCYRWTSREWLYRDPSFREHETPLRMCRNRWHRRLWGLDLIPATVRR